jgi:hypothetical protein
MNNNVDMCAQVHCERNALPSCIYILYINDTL